MGHKKNIRQSVSAADQRTIADADLSIATAGVEGHSDDESSTERAKRLKAKILKKINSKQSQKIHELAEEYKFIRKFSF